LALAVGHLGRQGREACGAAGGHHAHVRTVDRGGRGERAGVGLGLGDASALLHVGVQRNGDRGENADDRHDDQELDEREAALTAAARALERLYAVAPRDFTRARNALAAELRESRDADAARAIARLRRPSAPLWAVNQLSRHARPALERFLDAVDRLRRTQLSDPRGAMEAMRAERVQLEALVERAEHALAEAGYSASADARRRISDTLLGAAADR